MFSASSRSESTSARGFIELLPQLEDRLARFAQAVADLTAKTAQAVAGRGLRRIELGGDGLELDADRRQALQQRVVNLAADPGALGEHQRVLIAHGPQPEPPRRGEHQRGAEQRPA